jgi:hypothetical protein
MQVSRHISLPALILFLILNFHTFGQRPVAPPSATDAVLEKNAGDLVMLMAKGQFEMITARFNDVLGRQITAESMTRTWTRMNERFGPFQRILSAKRDPGSSVVNVTCGFAQGNVNVEFVFDAAQRVMGLWIQAAPGRHWPPVEQKPSTGAVAGGGVLEGDWEALRGPADKPWRYQYHFKPDGTGTLDASAKEMGIPVQYRFDGDAVVILGPMPFIGWRDGDHMVGSLKGSIPIVMVRKGAAVAPESLAGYWIGTVDLGSNVLAPVFELLPSNNGFAAFGVGGDTMPLRYSRDGNQVTINVGLYYAGATARMEYSATISGNTLDGTWLIPGNKPDSVHVKLLKVAEPGRTARYKSDSVPPPENERGGKRRDIPGKPLAATDTASRWTKPVNSGFEGFSFRLADYKSARVTNLVGINDSGVVVGYYISKFPADYRETANYPFVISQGRVTVLHGPVFDPRVNGLDTTTYTNTMPLGINNKGHVLLKQSTCSFINNECRRETYYLYNVNDGSVRPVGRNFRSPDHPGENFQAAAFVALNDRGELLGWMITTRDTYMTGFPFYGTPKIGASGSTVEPATSGFFTQIPGCSKDQSLTLLAIDDLDRVAGVCPEDANGPQSAVFYADGKFTHVRFPGSLTTIFTGISSSGLVSGYYQSGEGLKHHGFLFDGSQFFPVIPPGSTGATIEASMPSASTIVVKS